jgi:hypothetical protein
MSSDPIRAFRRRPSRHFWMALVVAIPCTLALMAILSYKFGELGQRLNMNKVQRFIDTVKPTVWSDPDLAWVALHNFTMDDGCLLVQGVVGTDQALGRLKSLLAPCPRPIRWSVEVVGPENLKDYERSDDDPSAAASNR